MRRREALAGVASLGALGGGVVVAARGLPSVGPLGDDEPDPAAVDPVEIETLELPWIDGEPVTVPAEGTASLVELFATTCDTCAATLSELTAAHERAPDDVQFLSVTSQRVGPDGHVSVDGVVEWWETHGGGEWAIGTDRTAALGVRYDLPTVPATILFDEQGVARWTHEGPTSTDELIERIEAVTSA